MSESPTPQGDADTPARRGPRRRRLLSGAALAGAVVVGGGSVVLSRSEPDTPVPGVAIPDIAPAHMARFGFTISNPSPDGMDEFIADLDVVQRLGMGAVRFSAPIYEIAADWGVRDGRPGGTVRLDPTWLRALTECIDLALGRGLQVCVMAIGVYPGEDVADEDLPAVMSRFWTALASALAPRELLWQILNEPDGSDFRTYETLQPLDHPDYVRRIAEIVGTARDAIHAAAPGSRVTTNLFGFPIDEDIVVRWEALLDVIAPSVDVITVDAYPETGELRLEILVRHLARLRERYGKPLEVGEIGVKTCAECFTEREQAESYASYLEALQSSAAETVYFYALRDDPGRDSERFGVIAESGRAKPAIGVIVTAGA